MNNNFRILFLNAMLLSSFALHSQLEVKFNIASAAFLVPNIGLELPLSERSSLQLDVLASFHDDFRGSPLHINENFLEYRYYFKEDIKGLFFGAHVGYGMFTLKKPSAAII
jgi:hypothetical protein